MRKEKDMRKMQYQIEREEEGGKEKRRKIARKVERKAARKGERKSAVGIFPRF